MLEPSPPDTTRIRVVPAEDVNLRRELIERLLRTAPGIELIGAAANVDAPARLRRICPTVRLLALSASLRDADVRRAFDSGFDGYSTKEVTPELLAERVRSVASGRRYLDPEVSGALAYGRSETIERDAGAGVAQPQGLSHSLTHRDLGGS